jgi:predicted protein tyrosine phosphatase
MAANHDLDMADTMGHPKSLTAVAAADSVASKSVGLARDRADPRCQEAAEWADNKLAASEKAATSRVRRRSQAVVKAEERLGAMDNPDPQLGVMDNRVAAATLVVPMVL